MAPDLVGAVEVFQPEMIEQFLSHGWPVTFVLTSTGIALYSLLLGVTEEELNKSPESNE